MLVIEDWRDWNFIGCWGRYRIVQPPWRRSPLSSLPPGSLASGQTTRREHSPTYQQKIRLKIYWAWPCLSEQDPVSPSVSLSHQEPSISRLSFSIEGRQNENHIHRKLTNRITWTTALSNSIKLWAMPCRATQDRRVMVESSDKTWSTGERNGKPLQYSCLENPMNSMKRQNDRTLKEVGRCPICYRR